MITTEDIKNAIESNDRFAVNCMLKIYEYQTTDEQSIGDTRENNGVGFSGADGEILSSFVKQVQNWDSNKYSSPLSRKQMEIAQKKMKKYVKQLLPILTEDDFKVEPYPQSALKEDTRVSVTGVVKVVKEPRRYQYGDKFFLLLKTESDELNVMVDIKSIDDPQREIPEVGDTVSTKANIKNGWITIKLTDEYSVTNDSEDNDKNEKVRTIKQCLLELKSDGIISESTYNCVVKEVNEMVLLNPPTHVNKLLSNIHSKTSDYKSSVERRHEKTLSDLLGEM